MQPERMKALQEKGAKEITIKLADNKKAMAAQLIQTLKAAQQSSSYVFRGMHKDDFELKPSIARLRSGNRPFRVADEKIVLSIIKAEGAMYFERGDLKDIDLLAMAQHFGAPTRLLDWTFNPFVALYFSVFSSFRIDREASGIVFVYRTRTEEFDRGAIELNTKADDKPFVDKELFGNGVKFVMPRFIDQRIRNQKGLFSIQANPETEFSENCSCQRLTYMIVPADLKNYVARYLYDIGMFHDFIMPGLAGFCETVGYRYRHNKGLRTRYLGEEDEDAA
jgi:FRG domain